MQYNFVKDRKSEIFFLLQNSSSLNYPDIFLVQGLLATKATRERGACWAFKGSQATWGLWGLRGPKGILGKREIAASRVKKEIEAKIIIVDSQPIVLS